MLEEEAAGDELRGAGSRGSRRRRPGIRAVHQAVVAFPRRHKEAELLPPLSPEPGPGATLTQQQAEDSTEAMLRNEHILQISQEMEEKSLTLALLAGEGMDVASLEKEVDGLRRQFNDLKLQQSQKEHGGSTSTVMPLSVTDRGQTPFNWRPESSSEDEGSSEGENIDMGDFLTP